MTNIPLFFFHYSGFDIRRPNEISKYQNRYTFEERKDIVDLFETYRKELLKNGYRYFAKIPCKYQKKQERYLWGLINAVNAKKAKKFFDFFIPPFFQNILRKTITRHL